MAGILRCFAWEVTNNVRLSAGCHRLPEPSRSPHGPGADQKTRRSRGGGYVVIFVKQTNKNDYENKFHLIFPLALL